MISGKKCPRITHRTHGLFYIKTFQSAAFDWEKQHDLSWTSTLDPIDSLSERKSIDLCNFGTPCVCALCLDIHHYS